MSKYFHNPLARTPRWESIAFHREWINKIKRSLGNKCVFLSYINKTNIEFVSRAWPEGGERLPQGKEKTKRYFLHAIFRMDNGDRRTITFEVEGTPQDVDNKNYMDVQKELIDYARTEGFI